MGSLLSPGSSTEPQRPYGPMLRHPTCHLGVLGQVSFKSVTANMFVLVQISSELWEYSNYVLTYSAQGTRFTLIDASQKSCGPLHGVGPGQGVAGRPYWEARACSSHHVNRTHDSLDRSHTRADQFCCHLLLTGLDRLLHPTG